MHIGTRKLFILTLFLTLVVYAFFFVFYAKVNNAVGTISEEKHFAESQDKRLNEVRQLENFLSNNEQEIAKLSGYVVDEETVVDFIQTLEELAEQTGITLTISSVEEDGGMVTFVLETEGTWQGSLNFIFLVEKRPEPITVVSASLFYDDELTVWNSNVTLTLPLLEQQNVGSINQ